MMRTISEVVRRNAQGVARRLAVLVVALSLIAIPLSGGAGTAEAAADAADDGAHQGLCFQDLNY